MKTRFLLDTVLAVCCVALLFAGCSRNQQVNHQKDPHQEVGQERPNFILILTDDHRYDAMGFMGHPYLETPHLDRIAREGIQFSRAFVTTSLCSPSRASILTGMYAHNHGVVDNYHPVDTTLRFFPQYLQEAGYQTAFIGKWHMGGEIDHPQPGFDHWLSFKGQGTYWADGHGTSRAVPQNNMEGYNINGKWVPQKGYITDELTGYALQWLKERISEKPFFLYISHKAVHSDFVAADRHLGTYRDDDIPVPVSSRGGRDKPMWLINQRNSRHGMEFGYNLPDFDLQKYHRRYCETLLSVDENIGRIMDWLEESGEAENTLLLYMGDNGFQFGEQGLIDKRTAYKASVRIPMLIWWPGTIGGPQTIGEIVANIDIAPTLLDIAGTAVPAEMDGRSMKPLIEGAETDWRRELLYEYYWERNYPYTPTTHALITGRYKFIRYHGIWDLDEFYDLREDPDELVNLIHSEKHRDLTDAHRERLFELLEETRGMQIPLVPDRGNVFPLRNPEKSEQAPFPEVFISSAVKEN